MSSTLTRACDNHLRYLGRWATGTTAITITNGAECEFAYTGNTCLLQFDTTAPGIAFPIIAYWVDGAGPTRVLLDSTGLVSITPFYNTPPRGSQPYAEVSSSRHHVRFMANIESGYPIANNNWITQRDGVKFMGVRLADGESLLPIPDHSNLIEFLGDSITAGLGLLYTGARRMADAAPELNWPEYTSRLLGLRAIVNGHGGQGISSPATDGTPAAAAFPYVFYGVRWNPHSKPKVVVVYQGTNDSAFTAAQYQTYLGAIRSVYPGAHIFAIVPYQKAIHVAPIREAVAALSDSIIYFLDYGPAFSEADTNDHTHFNPGGAVNMGMKLANDIQSRLNSTRQEYLK